MPKSTRFNTRLLKQQKGVAMHRWIFFNTILLGIMISANAMGFDATGIWDYDEHSHTNTCGVKIDPDSGEMVILQNTTTFLIVGQEDSTYGTFSDVTYTYTDSWCDYSGTVDATVVLTLSSANSGTGTVNWTWNGAGGPCAGSHQLNIAKNTSPSNPAYNATGKWNFNQSNSWTTCGSSSTPPRESGYLVITQTDSRISAIDDEQDSYDGFVSGATYFVVGSSELGGRTSVLYEIDLASSTQGSGEAKFVWDDDCDFCNGGWDISVGKAVTTNINPAIPIILLNE